MTITEEVLIRGRADMAQMRRETERASKSWSDFASSAGDAVIRINQGLELASKAVGAMRSAFETADFAGEVRRLEKVVGRDLARTLQQATGGTVTQIDAMRAAARAMSGDVKLSAEQMRVLFAAADDLGKQFGEGTIPIVEKFTDSLRRGEVTELKKYGIALDTTKSKAEQLEQVFAGLKSRAENPLFSDETADNFDKFKVELQDAMDTVRQFVGELVIQLAKAIKTFQGFIASLRGEDVLDQEAVDFRPDMSRIRMQAADRLGLGGAQLQAIQFGGFSSPELEAEVQKIVAEERANFKAAIISKGKKPVIVPTPEQTFVFGSESSFGTGASLQFNAADVVKSAAGKRRIHITRDSVITTDFDPAADGRMLFADPTPTIGEAFERDGFVTSKDGQAGGAGLGLNRFGSSKSLEESARGVREARQEQVAAFEQTAGAISSSADAALGALGAVFGKEKEVMRLRAIIKVAEETALAASAFASFNVPGGIAHAAAAVSWGVVATKAGGSAGGGGGSSRAPSAGGGFANFGFGSSGSGGGGGTIIVQVGDGFVGEPHKLAEEITRRVDSAKRAKRITGSVVRHE